MPPDIRQDAVDEDRPFAESRFLVLGSRILLRSEKSAVVHLVNEALHRFAVRDVIPPDHTLTVLGDGEGSEPGTLWIARDGQRVAGSRSSAVVASQLLAEINRLALERCQALAIHAGVVSRFGAAIAFPGGSGTGKSTLTTACVMEGFDYVSDEALCIDRSSGTVIPYPRPLRLSPDSHRLLELPPPAIPWDATAESVLQPESLKGTIASQTVELAHVVLTRFGDDRVRLDPAPSSAVIGALLKMSFNRTEGPQGVYELVNRIAGRASGWTLSYGKPRDAARVLAETLAR